MTAPIPPIPVVRAEGVASRRRGMERLDPRAARGAYLAATFTSWSLQLSPLRTQVDPQRVAAHMIERHSAPCSRFTEPEPGGAAALALVRFKGGAGRCAR